MNPLRYTIALSLLRRSCTSCTLSRLRTELQEIATKRWEYVSGTNFQWNIIDLLGLTSHRHTIVGDAVLGIRTVASFNLEHKFLEDYASKATLVSNVQKKDALGAGFGMGITQVVMMGGFGAVFMYSVYMLNLGKPRVHLHGFDFFKEIDGKIHYMEDTHKANHHAAEEERICMNLVAQRRVSFVA